MSFKPRPPSLSTTGNPHWCSPPWILEGVRNFAGGQIALDPCGRPDSLVHASVEFHGLDAVEPAHRVDGLATRWLVPASLVQATLLVAYANPPFSRGVIGKWTAKARIEGKLGPLHSIVLVPLRPSSAWFKEDCVPPRASAVGLLERRVKYLGAPSGVPWESALIYYGDRPAWFADALSDITAGIWLA